VPSGLGWPCAQRQAATVPSKDDMIIGFVPQDDKYGQGPSMLGPWPKTYVLIYRQLGSLKEAIRVLQLKEPLAFSYSVVYQKVQSSTGSIVIAL